MSGISLSVSTSPDSQGGGFFQKFFSFLFRESDPEKDKRRLLKEIAKELNRRKYKFYKPKGGEALPGMARFFYETYKAVGPAQVLLENAAASGILKLLMVENSLSKEQLALKEKFTEEYIRERAKTADMKALSGEIKENMISFFSGFNSDKIREINTLYLHFLIFLQLVNFDYYFLLRKFDSALPERDFLYNPRFEQINGEYILDDLKDFMEVLPNIKQDISWGPLFETLKLYRNAEVVNSQVWKKVVKTLADIEKDGIFELIIRHLSRDPYYKAKAFLPDEKIVEDYLNKIKTQTELTVQKILKERQNQKVDKLLKLIFGTTAVSRMKFYTEKANLVFSKKMLGGFLYIAPMNYLKAFLLDYFKKDVKMLVDLLLIRGQWSTNITSQQLSDSYHTVMEVADNLLRFDDSLSDEGETGIKLKNMMLRADRDKNSMMLLRKQLKETNDSALRMIQISAQGMINVGKIIKQVLDDYDRKPHELIINWKELDGASEKDIRELCTEVYKQIYYLVQLLQYFVKKEA